MSNNNTSAGIWVKASERPNDRGLYYVKLVNKNGHELNIFRDLRIFDPSKGQWEISSSSPDESSYMVIEWLDESKAVREEWKEDEIENEIANAIRTSDFHIPKFLSGIPCADGSQSYGELLEKETIALAKECVNIFKRFASPAPSVAGSVDVIDNAAEKEVMMKAFDKVRQLFERRSWIMEGRGAYRYDDDRYKQEIRYLYDEFDAIQKETWHNIKSKSVDFRNQVIAEYVSSKEAAGSVEERATCDDLQDQVREHIKQDKLFDWHEALTENEMSYLENLLLTFCPLFPVGSIGYEKQRKHVAGADNKGFAEWASESNYYFINGYWYGVSGTKDRHTSDELYNGPYQEYLKQLK